MSAINRRQSRTKSPPASASSPRTAMQAPKLSAHLHHEPDIDELEEIVDDALASATTNSYLTGQQSIPAGLLSANALADLLSPANVCDMPSAGLTSVKPSPDQPSADADVQSSDDDDEYRFNAPIHYISDSVAPLIRGVFLCEFHATAGPRITVQDPSGYIGKEHFDTVSRYIIPNTQLQRTYLSVTLLDHKILGYPVRIAGPQYPRNAFYFNLCFVFDPHQSCAVFEPIVRKLTEHLLLLEHSERMLSLADGTTGPRLQRLFRRIRHGLNVRRRCMPMVGASFIPLCIARTVRREEHVIEAHSAAVLDTRYRAPATASEALRTGWDLTSGRIAPFLNGYHHLARIASLTDVHEDLVIECVRHMVRLGVAHATPVFQYNNVYRPTPKLSQLAKCRPLQVRCMRECALCPCDNAMAGSPARAPEPKSPEPTVRDCFRMFASMAHGATFGELCVRFRPRELFIDERRLVRFGLIEGLIRRVDRYPVTVTRNLFGDAPSMGSTAGSRPTDAGYRASKPLRRGEMGGENASNAGSGQGPTNRNGAVQPDSSDEMPFYDGRQTLDELCCRIGISVQKLEAKLARDRHVIVLLK